TVEQLLTKPFLGLNYQEKLEVKRLGPHQPDLKLEQSLKDGITTAWYEKKKWLCGSASRKSLFCFPCLLFGGEVAWTQTGANDLKHLSDKIQKHELCKCHLDNSIKLATFGSVNIATQLDESYHLGIRKHNEEVDKNRYILSKLIDCEQFCGAFELALRGHDETESSLNPRMFRDLVDLVSSIDNEMEKHVKTATVLKGTSKTIQNELLDVTRDFIIQQLRSTEYVTIQADDTIDVSTKHQSVLVYRYIDGNSKIVERFYGFTHLKESCAESIATALLDQLNIVFPEHCEKQKLITQSYNGTSVMHGESGRVQRNVRDRYPNVHYAYCYAHQLNLIMKQGFPAFFSRSPKRTEVLDATVARRLPSRAAARWNFNIRSDKTIEHSTDFESTTIREARGIIRMLEDIFFSYDIMPHIDVLYSQLQKRDIDTVCVERVTTKFVSSINKVWESIEDLGSKLPDESEFPTWRRRCRTEIKTMNQVAREVCDIIIVHAQERFAFTKHLVSTKLLQSDLFERHNQCFPLQTLTSTMHAYPMLNKERLHTELLVIYGKPEFHGASGTMALFRLFLKNNLQDTFSESVKLLRILITTPITTVESERCFSKLKTFLRNTMNQDRLNALTMLSMEKQLIQEI
uniref:TTF-type domain-containing protein n=1 Tax=Latimeria chalumnae TaxID=7897 RepID=H3A7F9_LATCH